MPDRVFGISLAIAATLTVAIAIVIGASIIEGPEQQREQRFDRIRVTNLNHIGLGVDCYWSLNDSLPEDLPTLIKEMEEVAQQKPVKKQCTPSSTKDLETGEPYIYRRIDDTRFELCATFTRASRKDEDTRSFAWHPNASRKWKHDAGAQCFTLTAVEIELPPHE